MFFVQLIYVHVMCLYRDGINATQCIVHVVACMLNK